MQPTRTGLTTQGRDRPFAATKNASIPAGGCGARNANMAKLATPTPNALEVFPGPRRKTAASPAAHDDTCPTITEYGWDASLCVSAVTSTIEVTNGIRHVGYSVKVPSASMMAIASPVPVARYINSAVHRNVASRPRTLDRDWRMRSVHLWQLTRSTAHWRLPLTPADRAAHPRRAMQGL